VLFIIKTLSIVIKLLSCIIWLLGYMFSLIIKLLSTLILFLSTVTFSNIMVLHRFLPMWIICLMVSWTFYKWIICAEVNWKWKSEIIFWELSRKYIKGELIEFKKRMTSVAYEIITLFFLVHYHFTFYSMYIDKGLHTSSDIDKAPKMVT